MSLRCEEQGWDQIGLMCSAGRRSLWLRVNYTAEEIARAEARIAEHGPDGGAIYATEKTVESFELCAGREGDDDYVKVDQSNPQFAELLGIMLTARYAAET